MGLGVKVWRAARIVGIAMLAAVAIASARAPHRGAADESAAIRVRYAEGTVHGFL